MKYNAKQLADGSYAVFEGRKYFTSTVTDNEPAAQKQALIMSAQWYYHMAEKAFDEAEKNGLLGEYDGCLGDWLC